MDLEKQSAQSSDTMKTCSYAGMFVFLDLLGVTGVSLSEISFQEKSQWIITISVITSACLIAWAREERAMK